LLGLVPEDQHSREGQEEELGRARGLGRVLARKMRDSRTNKTRGFMICRAAYGGDDATGLIDETQLIFIRAGHEADFEHFEKMFFLVVRRKVVSTDLGAASEASRDAHPRSGSALAR
jgi:hypothetical protein